MGRGEEGLILYLKEPSENHILSSVVRVMGARKALSEKHYLREPPTEWEKQAAARRPGTDLKRFFPT